MLAHRPASVHIHTGTPLKDSKQVSNYVYHKLVNVHSDRSLKVSHAQCFLIISYSNHTSLTIVMFSRGFNRVFAKLQNHCFNSQRLFTECLRPFVKAELVVHTSYLILYKKVKKKKKEKQRMAMLKPAEICSSSLPFFVIRLFGTSIND